MENLFKHFDIDSKNDNKATCKLCLESIDHCTTHNLKIHLRNKHSEIAPSAYAVKKKKTAAIWAYFKKGSFENKIANCLTCGKRISHRTTISNLKAHLKNKHTNVYSRFERGLPPKSTRTDTDSDSNDNSNDETEEAQKLNDVWNYFEQEGSKVRCVVCREVLVDSAYDNLKGHLFEQHPKLLLHLEQEQDQDKKSDTGSGNEDNTYTEVVYLEQDTHEDTPRPISKPKITSIYSQQRAKKRTRNNSSSDHPIVKLKKEIQTPYKERAEKAEEDSELEVFIKYIRCLLKKLSPDAFSKVQVDILKTIMDAQYSSKITDIKDTSTISGTSILTDIANGSAPNVIRVSEIATQNGAIVGNYTVTLAPKGDNLDSSST